MPAGVVPVPSQDPAVLVVVGGKIPYVAAITGLLGAGGGLTIFCGL